jgi:hypothetical protein
VIARQEISLTAPGPRLEGHFTEGA